MQENDDETKIHIGNCVTLEQPAKKYAQPVSESPKYAFESNALSIRQNSPKKLISFRFPQFFAEFPLSCHRFRRLWRTCRGSSPVTTAATVVFTRISVFTYQNRTSRHRSVRSMYGAKAIRRIRKPTMAPNQRRTLPTMRNF